MASDKSTVEVVVCLGSSCFARGNSQNLAAIEVYLANHGIQNRVHVRGCLCQDECKRGPNLIVRGQCHHDVDEASLREILPLLTTGSL